MHDTFDDWYYEECSIAASELVGSNSIEWNDLHNSLYEDEERRAKHLIYFMQLKNFFNN